MKIREDRKKEFEDYNIALMTIAISSLEKMDGMQLKFMTQTAELLFGSYKDVLNGHTFKNEKDEEELFENMSRERQRAIVYACLIQHGMAMAVTSIKPSDDKTIYH